MTIVIDSINTNDIHRDFHLSEKMIAVLVTPLLSRLGSNGLELPDMPIRRYSDLMELDPFLLMPE